MEKDYYKSLIMTFSLVLLIGIGIVFMWINKRFSFFWFFGILNIGVSYGAIYKLCRSYLKNETK